MHCKQLSSIGRLIGFMLVSALCGRLAMGQASSAPSSGTSHIAIPVGLDVCEGGCLNSDGNLGTWIFHGQKAGKAQWSRGGQVATVTIQQYDASRILIKREDAPTSSSPGFTAIYQGTLRGNRIDGTAFATWPGHFPNGHPAGHVQYSWFATIPTTTCSPAGTSAQDAAEIGQKAVRFRQPLSAFGCFLIAAQKGDGQSKAIVGLMYRDGIGTAVNYDEAVRWLKAGAIQGDYNAQLGLAQVYEVGIGTKPDAKLAQMWKQRADTNPVIVAQRQQQQQQAQQQQAAQQMMFLGLAAVVEAMSRPDVYVVY